jgi:hypothetical protein
METGQKMAQCWAFQVSTQSDKMMGDLLVVENFQLI